MKTLLVGHVVPGFEHEALRVSVKADVCVVERRLEDLYELLLCEALLVLPEDATTFVTRPLQPALRRSMERFDELLSQVIQNLLVVRDLLLRQPAEIALPRH